MESKIIAIDFDNTIFTELFPGMGDLMPGAKENINKLYNEGHIIIINTCREGVHAEMAKQALASNGIKWHYFNQNGPVRVAKYQSNSRKIGCDISIDDRDINVKANGGVVDWDKVGGLLDRVLHPKKKIICIVGESGSGKSYIAEYLRANHNINMIESYTDRPKRSEDEVGHTFISKEQFDELDMREMIAFTAWKGENGDIVRYCCLTSDVTDDVMTYVIDERGLKYLRKYWSDVFTIFAVRVFAPDSLRSERISKERMERDKGNFTLGDSAFDYFIDNDYSDQMEIKYERLYKRITEL